MAESRQQRFVRQAKEKGKAFDAWKKGSETAHELQALLEDADRRDDAGVFRKLYEWRLVQQSGWLKLALRG